MRFRKVEDGLPAAVPKSECPPLLLPISLGTCSGFIGEPLETSNWPELEFFCLAPGHISSLCPGVSGVKTDRERAAKNKYQLVFTEGTINSLLRSALCHMSRSTCMNDGFPIDMRL